MLFWLDLLWRSGGQLHTVDGTGAMAGVGDICDIFRRRDERNKAYEEALALRVQRDEQARQAQQVAQQATPAAQQRQQAPGPVQAPPQSVQASAAPGTAAGGAQSRRRLHDLSDNDDDVVEGAEEVEEDVEEVEEVVQDEVELGPQQCRPPLRQRGNRT